MSKLVSILGQYVKFINETDTHYIFRCPYCGDSLNPNHGHLYISKEKPVFYCVRCGKGGSLSKLFIDLHVTSDTNIISNIYKSVKLEPTYYNVERSDHYKLVGEPAAQQKEYLEKRIGKLTNNVTKNWNAIFTLNKKYCKPNIISFITFRGKLKISRFMNNPKLRYLTEKLNPNIIFDVYMIKNFDTIMNARKYNTIILAEGIFDLLAEYNINSLGIDNALYVASLGKSKMKHTLDALCLMLLRNKFENLIILSDADVNKKIYQHTFGKYANNIVVTYSIIGKDWAGV